PHRAAGPGQGQHPPEGLIAGVHGGFTEGAAQVVISAPNGRDAGREIGVRSTQHIGGPADMATGTVKRFSDDKGFGFITPDEGGRDPFVHHTGIVAKGYRSLAEGTRVSYDEEQGDKGPKAVNVQKL